MTPTIECFDDQSVQMPPATVLCNNLFSQANHQTSASDRIDPSSDIRTNHQWTHYLRNRHLKYNKKINTSTYTSGLKADVKSLFNSPINSSDEDKQITEEHLNVLRKRQVLLLVTIQTMKLFRHNQILEHKLSVLHKRVVQIKKGSKTNNDGSTLE